MTRFRAVVPAVLLTASVLWAAALVAAPYQVQVGAHQDGLQVAAVVYAVGFHLCHQRAERSYHPWGVQFPVCARCEGVYLAAPFGIVFALLVSWRRPGALAARGAWRRALLAVGGVTITTLAWEWTTGEMTSNVVRDMAGAALGSVVAAAVAAVTTGELR